MKNQMEQEEQRPLCECHGEPMSKSGKKPSGEIRWVCAVKVREKQRRYAERNADVVKERKRRYYERNREQILENAHDRYVKNRDEILEKDRERYWANIDASRATQREKYQKRQNSPEAFAEREAKRLEREAKKELKMLTTRKTDKEWRDPEAALFDEFAGLINNQIKKWHSNRLNMAQQSAHLEWEDLRQTARAGLWERRDELEGITEQYERGRVALRIINSSISKELNANAFFRSAIYGKQAKERKAQVPELVPIVHLVQIGADGSEDATTFDFVDDPEDFTEVAEWKAAFSALKPRNQQAIAMRQLDWTWHEIASYFGITDTSLNSDLRRDLERHGLLDEMPELATPRHYDNLPTSKLCEQCGNEFFRGDKENAPRWFEKRYCSFECSQAAKQERAGGRPNYIPPSQRPRCTTPDCDAAVRLKVVAGQYTGDFDPYCNRCTDLLRLQRS